MTWEALPVAVPFDGPVHTGARELFGKVPLLFAKVSRSAVKNTCNYVVFETFSKTTARAGLLFGKGVPSARTPHNETPSNTAVSRPATGDLAR